ncbi:MAG: biopolymer transporter ExbD [Woeseia sp.]
MTSQCRPTETADSKQHSDIDMTPMLDVVFIMLIFFLVTASFVRESGISVDRPDGPARSTNDDATILLTIDDDSRYWIKQRLIDPRALRANLERLGSEAPGAPVVVNAAPRSRNAALVIALDAARAAGLYNVAMVEN